VEIYFFVKFSALSDNAAFERPRSKLPYPIQTRHGDERKAGLCKYPPPPSFNAEETGQAGAPADVSVFGIR